MPYLALCKIRSSIYITKAIFFQPEIYPTIICTTENVSVNKIKKYEEKKVRIIKSGKGKQVDLRRLMPLLKDLKINTILLEGGGNLNWSFIKNDLIDEIRLTVAPWIVGGKDAISLVEGIGFNKMNDAIRFDLIEKRSRNNYVTLIYRRKQ